MLGTSLSLCPKKFERRVSWTAKLWEDGLAGIILFTGKQDYETNDTDQAEDAKRMAIRKFGIPEEVIFTVGGNTTQENLVASRNLLSEMVPKPQTVFIVSENRHLIRAMSAAKAELGEAGIKSFPKPVDGVKMLDPNDPWVILELIKAVAYKHLFHRTPEWLPQKGARAKKIIARKVQEYETLLRSRIAKKQNEG